MGFATPPDLLALRGCCEAQAIGHALGDGVVARLATEDEDDRRQHVALRQSVDHLGPPRRDDPGVPQPARAMGHARDVLV